MTHLRLENERLKDQLKELQERVGEDKTSALKSPTLGTSLTEQVRELQQAVNWIRARMRGKRTE